MIIQIIFPEQFINVNSALAKNTMPPMQEVLQSDPHHLHLHKYLNTVYPDTSDPSYIKMHAHVLSLWMHSKCI